MKLVIFTDLDGTLLDKHYSFDPALPALNTLKAKGIPCVFCSSKTFSEMERYRTRLQNTAPFICENGGAIYVPTAYFNFPVRCPGLEVIVGDSYSTIVLGTSYEKLREEVLRLRANGFPIHGFGDMTPAEIARHLGLSEEEANLAKEREFEEPFLFLGGTDELKVMADLIHRDGFSYAEGPVFHHLRGKSDKGKAVSIVIDLYRQQYGTVVTAALGDGPNDILMLQSVDYAIAVQKADGSTDPRIKGYGFAEANGPGPVGWNKAVLHLLTTLSL